MYSGNLDLTRDGRIAGWCANFSALDERCEVRVKVGTETVSAVTANAFREDLLAAGIGDGKYGFSVTIPLSVQDRLALHGGEVSVYAGSGDILLGRYSSEPLRPEFTGDIPWIDRNDWEERALALLHANRITEEELAQLRHWHDHGYLILRNAISDETIARFADHLNRIWAERPACFVNSPSIGGESLISAVDRTATRRQCRILNIHNLSQAAVDILLAEKINRLVYLFFNASPVLMQSLTFECGSEQNIHADYAFVHTRHPAYLAASWIALEDVRSEGGPLFFYPGSHKNSPKYLFGASGILYANDDIKKVIAWERHLQTQCEALNTPREYFMARRGDVLLWHSALAHGGDPVKDVSQSRFSLVGHYSTRAAYPSERRHPHTTPHIIRQGGGMYYEWCFAGHLENRYR